MTVDSMGNILPGSGDEECIVQAEIDRNTVLKIRTEFPFLKDRVF